VRFYLCARRRGRYGPAAAVECQPNHGPGSAGGLRPGGGALQNAASVAGLLLTTEAMVAEKPKEEKPATPPMPHGAEDF